MPGLSQIVKVAEAMQAPVRAQAVVLLRQRCTRYRHQASSCSRCAEACPSGALSLTQTLPVVDAAVCQQCGACASICPTEALALKKPSSEELAESIAAAASQPGGVTLACNQAGSAPAGSVSITCLARIDSSLLLLALAKGASQVNLLSGLCGGCALGDILPALHKTITAAETLAEGVGATARINLRACPRDPASPANKAGASLSRRSFLRIFGKGGAGYTASAATALIASDAPEIRPNAKREELLAHHLPEKRARLLLSLRALAANGASAPLQAPKLDAARCSGCAICAQICPTGALAAEETAGKMLLTCDAGACVACNLCAEACYQHALVLCAGSENQITLERVTLLERQRNDALLAPVEDKMGRLLGVSLYST